MRLWCFAVYDGASVPARIAARYAQIAYHAVAVSPAMLRRFDFATILSGDNLLAFVFSDDDILAAAYAQPDLRDGKRVLRHAGYVFLGKKRGSAKLMIAALHVADAYRSGAPADGEAVARVLPDGEINEASTTVFTDAGFHGVRNYTVRIGPADVHLVPFAAKWPDGYWIGCHLMAGKAEKIAARSADILADWTLTWGPRPSDEPPLEFGLAD